MDEKQAVRRRIPIGVEESIIKGAMAPGYARGIEWDCGFLQQRLRYPRAPFYKKSTVEHSSP